MEPRSRLSGPDGVKSSSTLGTMHQEDVKEENSLVKCSSFGLLFE